MAGTVFNVFLGGTSENLSVNDYEVSMALTGLLKSDPNQKEYVDYVFYDGVDTVGDRHRYPVTPNSPVLGKTGEQLLGEGSDNILHSVTSLVGGRVEPLRLVGMVTQEKRHPLPETPMNLRAMSPQGIASLEDNLKRTQELNGEEQQKVHQLIAAIRAKNITQVNLIGWSRGGYNAIRIAHHLNTHYPRIRVNILAFDPVPGPLNHTNDTMTLPPNVVNYASLIALNEYRLGFIPVIPKAENPQKTRRVIKTIPGNHSAMMGERQRNISNLDPISLVSDRALRFALDTLKEWGAVNQEIKPDAHEGSDWTQVHNNISAYQHMVSETKGLNGLQVLNYQSTHNAEGTTHSRLIHDKEQGYRYLSDIPGLQHNPPDAFTGAFGIVPDTCALHRDYNDRIIAKNIAAIVQFYGNTQEKLYQLQVALEARYQTRGRDEVLSSAIECMNGAAAKQDSIFFAASLGDVSTVEKYKNDLSATIGEGDTPLMIAARKGNENFVQELIRRNVDFTLKNKAGETALAVAARYGKIGVLNRLMKSYSVSDQIDALMIAAKYKQKFAVQSLAGAIHHKNPLLLCHEQVRFLLMWSVENNDIKLLNSLLSNSHVLINLPLNAEKQTVLSYAQSLNRREMVANIQTCAPKQNVTSKPFITTPRVLIGVGMVGSLAYSSTALAATVHSMSGAVSYSSLTETLFVATRLNAPVAISAIVLTSLAVLAAGYLAYQAYEHGQTKKVSATLR